jgi:hypothetical protein
MANDVEENPGPTVYDVVDPSQTICADFSQGNTGKFRENAGKQCVAMCLTAVLHNQQKNIDQWDSSFLNVILCAGNGLYSCISSSINKPFLLLTDLPEMVSIFDKIYYLQYSNPFAGDLFMTTDNLPHYSLENALNNLFFNSQLNYRYCLLTIDCNTVAILKTSDSNFKIFDPHSREMGISIYPFGKCVLVSAEGINNLMIYFQNTVPQGNVTPFEVKGVSVQLQNSEITHQNTSNLCQSTAAKEKDSHETENEKQTRILENDRNYRKRKRATESENDKQTRLENDKKYQREKLAKETENEKQTRLENGRKYKKRKQAKKTVTENNENQVRLEQSSSNNIVSQQDYLKEFDIKKNGSIHDQSWAKANITKFHKSVQHAISVSVQFVKRHGH